MSIETLMNEYFASSDPAVKTQLLAQVREEMEKQGLSRNVEPKKIKARIAQMMKEIA